MTKEMKKSLWKLRKTFKSFSLVELIIVIAIIAILSVAGFVTLTKWIGKSRNSRRMSDLHTIQKVLTLHYTQDGTYPAPSNQGSINYSGSNLWKQGIFGKETIDKIDELVKVPTDPLTKTGYDYSVTENKKKYEISAAMERIGIVYKDIRKYVNKVYANDYYSKVLGNYDSLSLGVKTGDNNCYTLSIPSIIISDFTGKNIELEADGSKKYNFVMEGGKNIGPSYKKAFKKKKSGIKFGINRVYSKCEIKDLSDFNEFVSGLHEAYSGEKITEEESFKHNIGKINDSEDVSVKQDSYKELKDSGTISLSNDVNEEINSNISNNSDGNNGNNGNNGGEGSTINGTCGADDGGDFTTTPTNLCSAGTASSITDNGEGNTYDWTCNGENGGNDVSCSANHLTVVDGTCGADDGGDFTTTPTNLCSAGTASSVTDNGEGNTYEWTCNGENGGNDVSCSANHLMVVDGTCGVDDGGDFTSEPTNLCSAGTASNVTDNGEGSTYEWTCNGENGGSTASCSANHIYPKFWSDEYYMTYNPDLLQPSDIQHSGGYLIAGGPDPILPWNDGSTNRVDLGIEKHDSGQDNTNKMVSSSIDHMSAQFCVDLEVGGYTDWYLPSKAELGRLYSNRNTIGGFDNGHQWYWSSTEETLSRYVRYRNFDTGYQNGSRKDNSYYVRCIRSVDQ